MSSVPMLALLITSLLTGQQGNMQIEHRGSTPLDDAVAMTGGSFDGTWINVDPHTRDVVRISIAGRQVHPFGSCRPADCDMGTSTGQSFASKVDVQDVSALLISRKTGYSSTIMTLAMEPDKRLRLAKFVHFTDNSHRADYATVDYFTRSHMLVP